MRIQPSRRVAVLLEIGVIGYLLGAVAWMLFWPAIAGLYFLGYLGFPLSAVGLILAGLGCFALGKLYNRWLASVTGITYIATAVPFLLMNNLLPSMGGFSGSLRWLIGIGGFKLFTLSLFMWAVAGLDIAKLTHQNRLAVAIFLTSVITAVLIFIGMNVPYWSPLAPTLFATPFYVILEIISATMLHKIGLDTRQSL